MIELARRWEGQIHFILFQRQIDWPLPSRWSVHCLEIPIPSARPRLHKLGALVRGVGRLYRLRRRLGADVVISCLTIPNLLNALTRGPEATVLSVHSTLSRNLRGPTTGLVKALLPAAYARADVVVAVSEGVAADLESELGVKPRALEVISNPIDLDRARARANEPLPAPLQWLDQERYLVTVGRLVEAKGHDSLLRIFAATRARAAHRIRLVIVGGGPLEGALARRARLLGLATWAAWDPTPRDPRQAEVIFAGWQPNPFPFLRAATLFAFTSRWEGFGVALIEALACGLPVVSTDCPSGPREILGAASGERGPVGPGWLTPPLGPPPALGAPLQEPELAFVDAIDALLADEPWRARCARRARERAERFELGALAARWASLWQGR